MSDWPFIEGTRLVSQAHAAGTSAGTTLAAGAIGTNAKGATPTQLVASTAFDACGIVVTFGVQTTSSAALVDIMAGAGSAESVLLPDLITSVATGAESEYSYFFPIFIAKGTRLSARAAATAAITLRLNVYLLQGSFGVSPFSQVTAYGAVVGSSRGTDIDPGAVAHTKPALPATQLVAATTAPIRLMTVAVGQAGDFARVAAADALFDINRGASSAEYPVLDNILIHAGTSKDSFGPGVPVSNVPVYVPVGERLSARGQCSNTTAGDRAWDVIVYGVS